MLRDIILGQAGAVYLQGIDSIIPEFESAKYCFISPEEYASIAAKDLRESLRIYWSEILYRAHIAAATSIVRSRRWLEGLIREEEALNFLVCAASMRGLLEAAADGSMSLGPVPESLSQHFRIIEEILAKRYSKAFVSTELEDALIHYLYARKVPKGKDVPNSHHALRTQEYLNTLEKGGVPRVGELYAFLCDATHPGATSVHYLLEYKNESHESVGWLSSQKASDKRAVDWLVDEFGNAMSSILMFAFNPGLITLKVLNYFRLSEIRTATLSNWNFENITLWNKCAQHLRNQGVLR